MLVKLIFLFLLKTISHASFGSTQNTKEKNQRSSNGIGQHLWGKLVFMFSKEIKSREAEKEQQTLF